MPKPVESGQRYLPGLDGLRAIAVLAVIAYHEQFGWAPGGLLGVGVFFTLSGFLITSLLVERWSAYGSMRLGDFWLRRARRLLPALFVMLAVVMAWATVVAQARLAGLRGAVAAAGGYYSNWYLIAQHQSYFAAFAPPAPLDHLWSLAVEEQFYLLWPLLLVAGLLVASRRRGAAPAARRGAATAKALAVPALALSVVSAYAMARWYQPGLDPTRVYEGTDTRAFGLFIGAAVALAWPRAAVTGKAESRARTLLDAAGVLGLGVIAVMIWRVGEYSPFAYRGGLVLLSVAAAAVVAAAAWPASLVGTVLGWRPLRWIGVRSYGIYLWHFPVIVFSTPANAGPDLPRAAAQIAATIMLAALSWRFIEEPVRHGAIGRLASAIRGREAVPAGLLRRIAAGTAATAAAAVVVLAGVGLSGAVRGPASGGVSSASLQLPVTKSVVKAGAPGPRHGREPDRSAALPRGPLRTSCRAVAHLGDSTSDGLTSPAYLPNPKQRIVARYEQVGAREVITDIEGARSIVEVLPGGVNGYNAARAILRQGFHGCWVLALGTDDTADVAAGSTYTLQYRIRKMMTVTRGMPVLWVNVKSLVRIGPYAESSMQRWDRALLAACPRYPNMRVYDWAAEVHRKWFISDGIHYSSLGYMHRAKMIADALARAFPAAGTSTGCLVGS